MTNKFSLLTALLLTATATLSASTPYDEFLADSLKKAYTLDQVVVTATRTPILLKNTPVITRVISFSEIERSGSLTIQQVLENELAGVEFHQAGYGQSISFQGLDARYVLFLVDGERLAGETYGNIDFARIPVNNIDRIEIVRGASSVLYGSNAMGAVVNIITKAPDKPVHIRASASYGGYYQRENVTVGDLKAQSKTDIPNINADLYAGFNFGVLKSQTTVSYSGSDAYTLRSTRQEERHYDRLSVTEYGIISGRPGMMGTYEEYGSVILAPIDPAGLSVSGWKNINVTQRLDYDVAPGLKAYLSGGYFNKTRYDAPESINTGAAKEVYTYETYDSYNLKGGLEYRPDDKNMWLLSYNGDLFRRDLDSLEFSIPKQRHTYHIPRLLWTTHMGRYNRLTSGVEYLNENLNFDLSVHGFNDRKSLNTISAYVQDEISTSWPLSFTAGIRFDYNDRFDFSVTPKASARYSVGNCSLRANYSQGYRTPNIKELYMNYLIPMGGMGIPSTYIVGNPALQPEFNQYFSLAAEYINGFTQISATGFLSRFRDKIDVRREVSDGETHLIYDNIDRSTFSGVELMARARLLDGLFVTANYNYIHQSEEASEASTQYIFVSPHTATLQVDYRFGIGEMDFGINLSGKFIGRKRYEDMMVVMFYEDPALPTGMPSKIFSGNYWAEHEAYTLWNITLTAGLSPRLKLIAGVNNIFNYKAPIVNFNSAMTPGTNGFLKLVFNFE